MAAFSSLMGRIAIFVFLLALATPLAAQAQNTGGVFGPKVAEGHRSFQYRLAFVPEEDGNDSRWAQRLHGQVALDSKRMARLVVQGADRGGPDGAEFDFVQAELFWELTDDSATQWNSGLRFDARLSGDDRPDQLGVNWMNDFALADGITARVIGLSAVQVGDNAADGVLFSARGALFFDLTGGYSLALESYNSLGSTEDFGLDNRSQQFGPTLNGPFGDSWSWSVGNLFGLNDATPDNDFRVWITRNF